MNALDKFFKPIIKKEYPDLELVGWVVEFAGNEIEMTDDIDNILYGIENGSIDPTNVDDLRNSVITVKPPLGHLFLRLVKPDCIPILIIVRSEPC